MQSVKVDAAGQAAPVDHPGVCSQSLHFVHILAHSLPQHALDALGHMELWKQHVADQTIFEPEVFTQISERPWLSGYSTVTGAQIPGQALSEEQ
jgi:hypothetical protein